MKIVFFGTPNVALPILEVLNRHHDIAAVVTQPDAPVGRSRELTESPVSVLAGEMDIPIIKPETVKGNHEFRMQLESMNADVFIVVAYGKILPAELINMPVYKTLNVHFSLLPHYRGASPIQFALLNGDSQTGTSIMVLDEQLDHGPILAQAQYSIDSDDNYITLSDKLAHASAELLFRTLPQYASGQLVAAEQDHAQATFTKLLHKQDGAIDWDMSAQQIYNKFRAFYPWPGIWTLWNGKQLKITECMPTSLSHTTVPGTVLEDGSIACGQATVLAMSRLQLEGKQETDMKSFLNGYQDFVGSKLGSE